jgi:cytochrome P450
MEDFVYNGMYIPKNTALILNTYDLHHNKERYPDPYAPSFSHLTPFKAEVWTSRHRFTFNPDRFLGDSLTSEESSKLPDAMDRDHWAFGAGCVPQRFLPPSPSPLLTLPPSILCLRHSRRICPGIHIAERELWLAVSQLLWTYEIRLPPDEPISLGEYDGDSGRMPLPYRVALIPRHDRVQTLLEMEKSDEIMNGTSETCA